jgi:hypothetical protein
MKASKSLKVPKAFIVDAQSSMAQLRLSLRTIGWSIIGQRLTGYKSNKSELLDIERYRGFHFGEMEELLELSHMVKLQVATSFTNRIGTTDISCLNRLSLPH